MYLYLYLRNLLAEQEGQDIIEYVLILGLISIVAVIAMQATGASILGVWNNVSAAVGSAVGS